jgi:hypothetical protein
MTKLLSSRIAETPTKTLVSSQGSMMFFQSWQKENTPDIFLMCSMTLNTDEMGMGWTTHREKKQFVEKTI